MTNRQPKGTPIGGQFAEGRKPSGGDLGEPFANYIEKDVSGVDFSERLLTSGHFLGSKCIGTKFHDSYLKSSDFLDADCTDAEFDRAVLESAILMGKFKRASFRGADMSLAACYEADFAEADFTDAYVMDTNMRKVTGLETAKGLETVTGEPSVLPDGWSYKHGRGIFKDIPSTERKAFRVTNSAGVPFEVRIIRKGERYGLNNMLVNDEGNKFFNPKDPILVEFWDAGQDPAYFPGGCQFTGGRYSLTTLVSREGARSNAGLNLYGGEPRWSIDAKAMQSVCEWLTPIVGEIEEAS